MWEYILLGAIQGIFEWIPISSEGVVALFSSFLAKDFNSIDIALFLHLGTFFAVLVYFWKDWLELISFKDKEFLKFFVIVMIVSGAIGFSIYSIARTIIIGPMLLLIMGLGLLLTSFMQSSKRKVKINSFFSPLLVGFLQGISVIPGVSRSGSTIFGLSLAEDNPQKILKTSYLISAPVVLGSSLYLFLKEPELVFSAWPSLLFSFVFGIITLKVLLDFSEKVNFSKFTLIFGLICVFGALVSFL